jgi:hypothetical protein
MFRTDVLSIIRSISTLYTQHYMLVLLDCLLADVNITSMTNTYCCVYSVEIILMMESRSV